MALGLKKKFGELKLPSIHYGTAMDDNRVIRALFNKTYNNSVNMMTPNILGYYKLNEFLCVELSCGKSLFTGEMQYGVTFLGMDGKKKHSINKSFHSRKEALEHMDRIGKIS